MVPVLIVILLVLVFFSAFFSAAEICYATVNKLRVKKAFEKNEKNAKVTNDLCSNLSSTTTAILVGNNLVNIAASSLSTILFTKLVGDVNGPLVATAVMTAVILTFGEIIPKTIGTKFNYRLSFVFSKPIKFFSVIFKPIIFLVNKLIKRLAKKWNKDEDKEPTVTDEELITMVETIEEEGFIDSSESELIKSAIDFMDITAHEIMIPRVDIFAYDINDDINELIKDMDIYNHSRIPVYDDSLDNIMGIVKTRDILSCYLSKKAIIVKDMLSEPLYVHMTKPISAILHELKKSHKHMAIVKDEYGGTMGLLTMEDILEELVGDILDETDVTEEEYKKISENEYIIDGTMNIYDFFEIVNYDARDFESEYTTVGGWATDVLERFPVVDDKFDFENLSITIEEVGEFRVEKLKVEIKAKEEIEE